MSTKRGFFTGLLWIITVLSAIAQEDLPSRRGSKIIDDSTKQVYGPKTSRYYYEHDIYLNQVKLNTIDTAIHNFQRFTYVQRNEYKYQDLGNIGSAIRPVFVEAPKVIGLTSGFTSYDMYWNSEQIKLYDTKSPYVNMHVMLGGKGRSMTRATFSRNINPRWNFGFTYRALLIDKQVQRQSKGDRSVRSTYYDFYTTYSTKDSSYRVVASFRRNNLDADEYGGIRITDNFTYKDYFSTNAQPKLLDAAQNDLRMNFRVYQQYSLGSGLQIYNTFERYRQGTEFTDFPATAPADFYDYTDETIDGDTTQGLTKFKAIRNESGIKGNLLKLFYNGYYAIRRVSNYNLFTGVYKDMEHYLGGRIALRLDSLGDLSGWGELQSNGNYRLEGSLTSRWFEASLKQMQYSVPYMYQYYRGFHDFWQNSFDPINMTQLHGYLHYRSRVLNVSPGMTLTRVGNYVFMKQGEYDDGQTVLPQQASGEQLIFSPEVKLTLTFLRHVKFNSNAIYTRLLASDADAIQIPEWFINAQIAYENIHFNGSLDIQTGFEAHYQSTYYGLGYDVPMQSFYVQQQVKTKGFPIVDAFVSARIKRGRVFFKYNNIVQALTKEGYMFTPEYPGQRNILDFGFDWSFYD